MESVSLIVALQVRLKVTPNLVQVFSLQRQCLLASIVCDVVANECVVGQFHNPVRLDFCYCVSINIIIPDFVKLYDVFISTAVRSEFSYIRSSYLLRRVLCFVIFIYWC